jgi:hypothetical protein
LTSLRSPWRLRISLDWPGFAPFQALRGTSAWNAAGSVDFDWRRASSAARVRFEAMLVLGFVLELPWDIGLPQGFIVPSWAEDEDAAIPTDAIREGIGIGPPLSPDHALLGWAVFRTVTVPVQLPLAASDLAFTDTRTDLPDAAAQRRVEAGVQQHIEEHGKARRTVAFVNVPVEDIGDDRDGHAFFRALELLNTWLVSLGLSFDARLRPLTVGDFPEVIPYMPTAWYADGTFDRGNPAPMRLRTGLQSIRTYDDVELTQALEMFAAVMTAPRGLAAFYEMAQRAGSSMSSHRYREAVIDYVTAGEILITEVYCLLAPKRSVPEKTMNNIVKGPLADRARHLSRLLGHAFDPEDPESIVFMWWLHCYQQRHPIVHAGHDTIEPLAEIAQVASVKLAVDIREGLRAMELDDLAAHVRWGYLIDETGHGSDSFPDGDPRAGPI